MLQKIEELAELSVARGCGFAAIAIITMMVGLSAEMRQAMQAGGYATLLASMVLLIKAQHAEIANYRSTEVWIMLEPADRPDKAIAQRIIGTALRNVYLRYALHAACVAAGLLIGAVALGFSPVPPAA